MSCCFSPLLQLVGFSTDAPREQTFLQLSPFALNIFCLSQKSWSVALCPSPSFRNCCYCLPFCPRFARRWTLGQGRDFLRVFFPVRDKGNAFFPSWLSKKTGDTLFFVIRPVRWRRRGMEMKGKGKAWRRRHESEGLLID